MSIKIAQDLLLVTGLSISIALILFTVWLKSRRAMTSHQASIDELLKQRCEATARMRSIFRDEEVSGPV